MIRVRIILILLKIKITDFSKHLIKLKNNKLAEFKENKNNKELTRKNNNSLVKLNNIKCNKSNSLKNYNILNCNNNKKKSSDLNSKLASINELNYETYFDDYFIEDTQQHNIPKPLLTKDLRVINTNKSNKNIDNNSKNVNTKLSSNKSNFIVKRNSRQKNEFNSNSAISDYEANKLINDIFSKKYYNK